ncbi:MAG: hypothetical protein V7L23_18545 [Nostoc sp.]
MITVTVIIKHPLSVDCGRQSGYPGRPSDDELRREFAIIQQEAEQEEV